MMAIPAVIAKGEEGGLEAKGKKSRGPIPILYIHFRDTDCNEQRFLKGIRVINSARPETELSFCPWLL